MEEIILKENLSISDNPPYDFYASAGTKIVKTNSGLIDAVLKDKTRVTIGNPNSFDGTFYANHRDIIAKNVWEIANEQK